MSPGVLVAGIGNIFLSDDGFGVEVANRLAAVPMPAGVRVADFGVRGVHLAYELLDGYDRLVLVDAVPMGEAPGTLAVIQPISAGIPGADGDIPVVDAHSMSPDVVLATLSRLGGSVEEIYIVGCQPASLDEGIGLSPSVASAVEGAMDLCRQLADGPVQLEPLVDIPHPALVAVDSPPVRKGTTK
jgi:hydrogenase maturation protease